MTKVKRASKRWSMKDIRFIQKCIKEKQVEGKEKRLAKVEGIQAAATVFGISYNAVWNRLYVYEKGQYLGGLKKNTTKIPVKTREYAKKSAISTVVRTIDNSREITFDIKDVRIDLKSKKITFIY